MKVKSNLNSDEDNGSEPLLLHQTGLGGVCPLRELRPQTHHMPIPQKCVNKTSSVFAQIILQVDGKFDVKDKSISLKISSNVFIKKWIIFILFLLLFFYLFTFRERRREREREGEKHQCVRDTLIGCLSHAPKWGPGLQPRLVP